MDDASLQIAIFNLWKVVGIATGFMSGLLIVAIIYLQMLLNAKLGQLKSHLSHELTDQIEEHLGHSQLRSLVISDLAKRLGRLEDEENRLKRQKT